MESVLAFSGKQLMSTIGLHTATSKSIMSWTVHLARQYPTRTIASLAFIIFVFSVGYLSIGAYVSAMVTVAIACSLSDFLFPVKYTITADKVSCRMLFKCVEIKWADVKRCYLDDYGVKLSPLNRVSRLEAFRGVYLRFANNKDDVIKIVKELRPANV